MRKNRDSVMSMDDVDERGRVVNRDVPEEARRGAKKGTKRKDTRKEKVSKLIQDSEEPVKKKRRKKVVEEEAPVKKKKRKEAPLKPPSEKALAKLERRKEKMLDDLNEIEYFPNVTQGDEFDSQYRGMFDNLRTITTLFETKMQENPSSRDVYALSTLYSQMREVIADIRSSKDVSQKIAELETQAYGSFLKLIGQTYVDLFFKLQKDIRTHVKDPDVQGQLLESLQGACKDQGDKVQAGYSSMLDRVRTVLM